TLQGTRASAPTPGPTGYWPHRIDGMTFSVCRPARGQSRAQLLSPRQEPARDPIFANKLCAALDQPGKAIEQPAAEYLPSVTMSEPKREAVAGNCSEHRGNEQRPRHDTGRRRERTDCEDEGRAWHHGSDHRNGFR